LEKLFYNSNCKKSHIGQIFDKILGDHYSDYESAKEITFDDLLNWDMWPTFIKIHSKYGDLFFFMLAEIYNELFLRHKYFT